MTDDDDTFDEVVPILCLDGLKDRVGNDVDVILVLAYITAAREIEPKDVRVAQVGSDSLSTMNMFLLNYYLSLQMPRCLPPP